MMDREQLHRLLRIRAEALRVPDEIIDRALARCARLEARAQRNGISARTGAIRTPADATAPTLGAATVPSLGGSTPGSGATVPSLGDAPAGPPTDATVPSLGDAPAGPPPRSGSLPAGRIIAGYRIESLLGKGGMGAVYRAIQLSMARPVAFKVLSPRLASDPTFVGRFKREARAAGRLHHPNLITVHEAGEAAGMVFFSMELVEGRSLKDVTKEQGALPPAQVVAIARQVLEALRFAHAKGVIHRDIKPDNVMLTASGQVKIADLGLSRIEDGHAGETTEMFKTEAGSFMGTPHYMAPEQCRDAHAADARADLYALGATCFHLACGKTPFDGTTPMEVMVAAQKAPLVFPDPPPPKALRDFIARLMEKDPDRRPPDAASALALLDRLFPAPQSQAPVRRTPLWRRLLRAAAWAVGLTIAVGLMLLALNAISQREHEREWEAVLAAAQTDADAMRWHEALERLAQARPGLEPAQAGQCDAASDRFASGWDAWALGNFAAIERAFRGHLAANRLQEASDLLKQVPEPWRSPAVEQRIQSLYIEAAEAARQVIEQKPDAVRPPVMQELLDRLQKRRHSQEAWSRAVIDPPASARDEKGIEVLNGTGTARLPLPPFDRALGEISLRLAWRGRHDAGARLTVDLGGGAQAAFTPDSATITIGGRTRPLPGGPFEGQALHLIRRDGAAYVLVRDGGGPVTIPIQLGDEVTLRWRLGGAEVAASLGGGIKRGDAPGPGR